MRRTANDLLITERLKESSSRGRGIASGGVPQNHVYTPSDLNDHQGEAGYIDSRIYNDYNRRNQWRFRPVAADIFQNAARRLAKDMVTLQFGVHRHHLHLHLPEDVGHHTGQKPWDKNLLGIKSYLRIRISFRDALECECHPRCSIPMKIRRYRRSSPVAVNVSLQVCCTSVLEARQSST